MHVYNILSEDLTIALHRGTIKPFSLDVIFLRIIPRTWLPSDVAILHCSETFMIAIIVTPKYFSFTVLLSFSFPFHSSCQCFLALCVDIYISQN